MSLDKFIQWLDEIEEDCRVEIINPYPERYERCLERSIKLTAALRTSYKALELITHPTKLGEHGDPWFYRQNRAEKAIQELHTIAGVNE